MRGAGRILIVDDDEDVTRLLDAHLSDDQHELLIAHTAAEMWCILRESTVDLILLDIILPDANGFELTARLRAETGAAIIIVTNKREKIDEIVGLEIGADDYVTKPFEPRNLLARVKSVLRRYSAPSSGQSHPEENETLASSVLTFGRWRLYPSIYRLVSETDQETVLSANESALLAHLVRNAGAVMSRDELMEATTGRSWEYMDRTVDILIARLRKKIEENPTRPKIIKTVRGAGYVLSVDEAQRSFRLHASRDRPLDQ